MATITGPALGPATQQPLSNAAAARAEADLALLRSLSVGSTLRAVVTQRLTPSLYQLASGGGHLTAQSPVPLTKGAALNLRVESLDPHPILRLERGPGAPPSPVALALRRALPLHQPPAQLMQQASTLAAALPRDNPTRTLLTQLLSTSVPARDVTPDTLRRTLDQSGLFMESRAFSGRSLPTDLKGTLLRLLATLSPKSSAPTTLSPQTAAPTPTPGQSAAVNGSAGHAASSPAAGNAPAAAAAAHATLAATAEALAGMRHLIDAALARVTVNQVNSLPDDSGGAHWRFDLPIRDEGKYQDTAVSIERDARSSEDQSADVWRARLRFDFGEQDAVVADLALRDGVVTTAIWCERASTAHRFETRLDSLRGQFARAGLDIGTLQCRASPAPPQGKRATHGPLVEERA